jgi:uncharacterized protein
VWQKDEIEKILGTDASLFCDYFDVTGKGNWEGKNILRILTPAEVFAGENHLEEIEFNLFIDKCLKKLRVERNKRTKPGLDDKIVLSWNALMLKAIAKAAVVLEENNLKELVVRNFNFLTRKFAVNDSSVQILHTWKNGIAKHSAFLDDYAYLADACIAVYELTFESSYLNKAREFCEYAITNFSDTENVFFYFTHKDQDDIIVRKKEVYDGATPSGNAIMAYNLARLAVIFDINEWRNRSDKMLLTISPAAIKYPLSFGIWAALLMQKIKGFTEIAVVGINGISWASAIPAEYYIPSSIIMASLAADEAFPMLQNRNAGDSTCIYICKDYICNAPINNLNVFAGLYNEGKI